MLLEHSAREGDSPVCRIELNEMTTCVVFFESRVLILGKTVCTAHKPEKKKKTKKNGHAGFRSRYLPHIPTSPHALVVVRGNSPHYIVVMRGTSPGSRDYDLPDAQRGTKPPNKDTLELDAFIVPVLPR